MINEFTYKAKGYTDLIRVKTSILVGIASVLGMWLALELSAFNTNLVKQKTDFMFKAVLGFIAGFVLSGALNCVNDIKDYHLDLKIKSSRPLPSKRISILEAKVWAFFLIVVGLFISSVLYAPVIIIVGALVALGISYSLYFQNVPVVKNILVAATLSSSFITGAGVILESFNDVPLKIILLSISSFFAIFLFEIHKDIGDIYGDQIFGKITIPNILGVRPTAWIIYVGYWALVLLFWIYFALNYSITVFLVLIIFLQSILLISAGAMLYNQSKETINQTRIEVYSMFALTLISLFLI